MRQSLRHVALTLLDGDAGQRETKRPIHATTAKLTAERRPAAERSVTTDGGDGAPDDHTGTHSG